MAEGDGTLYARFKSLLMEGVIDLATGGDTLKVTLHDGYTPSQAHVDWADVSAVLATRQAARPLARRPVPRTPQYIVASLMARMWHGLPLAHSRPRHRVMRFCGMIHPLRRSQIL